jgi:hypothetical protein
MPENLAYFKLFDLYNNPKRQLVLFHFTDKKTEVPYTTASLTP